MADTADGANSSAKAKEVPLSLRWHLLCDLYLPIKSEDSVWRMNREKKSQEPLQGWKLHISATILEACDLFERVAPLLISEDVQFKAPKSLDDLFQINCGLYYGYRQVGKFLTVYPKTENQAVELAEKLHKLTEEFISITVPYDEQYLPESSVFYRYGAFSTIEIADTEGRKFLALENPEGKLISDDRLKAVPDWLTNPFPNGVKPSEKSFTGTPLGTTYRIFRAITQRGKGGTYQAVDFSQTELRFCIVKEGRSNGELTWNGQDGYFLVQNEFEVLEILKKKYDAVPQVFESFQIFGNFYFAMEYVEGKSLHDIIKLRRRRLSIGKVIKFAIETAEIIEKIHQAGWIWDDCKPANLILTTDNRLRPIDFEGAYQIGKGKPFDWKTKGFSNKTSGRLSDIYALGAVVYFLLTGRLYDSEKPIAIRKLRQNISLKLIEIIEKLLSNSFSEISQAKEEFELFQTQRLTHCLILANRGSDQTSSTIGSEIHPGKLEYLSSQDLFKNSKTLS